MIKSWTRLEIYCIRIRPLGKTGSGSGAKKREAKYLWPGSVTWAFDQTLSKNISKVIPPPPAPSSSQKIISVQIWQRRSARLRYTEFMNRLHNIRVPSNKPCFAENNYSVTEQSGTIPTTISGVIGRNYIDYLDTGYPIRPAMSRAYIIVSANKDKSTKEKHITNCNEWNSVYIIDLLEINGLYTSSTFSNKIFSEIYSSNLY